MKAIFILGSPRTGSTILYQYLVSYFRLPFFSNFTNSYCYLEPRIGLLVQKTIPKLYEKITYKSMYGKSRGLFQPSEASQVLKSFFGGGHPSQIVSTTIVSRKKELNLKRIFDMSYILYGRPLVIKNAWNCFRLEYLTNAFPESCFIWIRRDIVNSAKSDLNARYITKSNANEWNSATPANYEELRQRHYCEQVVENQYEFSESIKKSRNKNFIEVWYEDFCLNPTQVLQKIGKFCKLPCGNIDGDFIIESSKNDNYELSDQDIIMIEEYVQKNINKFKDMVK